MKILEDRKQEYDESGLSGMLTMEERRLNTSVLLSEYMSKFVERKKDKISPVTYVGYTNMIKGRIRRFFDPLGVTIGSLTPQLIEDFLDTIADDGCNSSTQQRYYQIIGCCLKNAVRKDHIDRNPIEKVDRPKRAKFTASYYSRDEALQLLRCAKDELCYIPILLGVFYGMRRSEAVGLQWSSVDFENNKIHIDHKAYEQSIKGKIQVIITDVMKTDASKRTLPLIPQVREELLKHKAKQEEYRRAFGRSYCREWKNCVCVSPTGKILSPDFVTEHFGQILAEYGLRKIRFHDLRHTAATNMHQLTGDFYTVGEILGHTLKGIGISLGISTNLEVVTAQYVDVRLDRKKTVLETYHKALHPQKEPGKPAKPAKQSKKKSSEMEL